MWYRVRRWRAIKKAMTCKGWTNKAKLGLIYDLVRKSERLAGDILEIGSAWGRSTVLLCLASEKKVWSIDPHTGGLAYIQKGTEQNSYDEFMANLKRFGLHERVCALKTSSDAAFQGGPACSNSYSMVFIDGLHTSEGVKIDVEGSYPRLVNGGYMVFDDYFEETVKDYRDAIDNIISAYGATLVKDFGSRLVYLQKMEEG